MCFPRGVPLTSMGAGWRGHLHDCLGFVSHMQGAAESDGGWGTKLRSPLRHGAVALSSGMRRTALMHDDYFSIKVPWWGGWWWEAGQTLLRQEANKRREEDEKSDTGAARGGLPGTARGGNDDGHLLLVLPPGRSRQLQQQCSLRLRGLGHSYIRVLGPLGPPIIAGWPPPLLLGIAMAFQEAECNGVPDPRRQQLVVGQSSTEPGRCIGAGSGICKFGAEQMSGLKAEDHKTTSQRTRTPANARRQKRNDRECYGRSIGLPAVNPVLRFRHFYSYLAQHL